MLCYILYSLACVFNLPSRSVLHRAQLAYVDPQGHLVLMEPREMLVQGVTKVLVA